MPCTEPKLVRLVGHGFLCSEVQSRSAPCCLQYGGQLEVYYVGLMQDRCLEATSVLARKRLPLQELPKFAGHSAK